MPRYVTVIALVLVMERFHECAPPPLRLTIDCGSEEEDYLPIVRSSDELFDSSRFDVNSFCSMINRAIPKAVEDGRFVLVEPGRDQIGYGDSQVPVAVSPPKGFVPRLGLHRLKSPKLGIPKISVPKLMPSTRGSKPAPSIGAPMSFVPFKHRAVEESSAERMEKFKKGVQKLLHVVKVLGQIDHYLSERSRILVDKLSKTFSD
ncbi:unnamed protein product, partial [Iphiclides podalirius]